MNHLNTKVVTVMPCYDKKLEAVRPEFKFALNDQSQIKEVDTVLATHELVDLFAKINIKLQECKPYNNLKVEEAKEVSYLKQFESISLNPKALNI